MGPVIWDTMFEGDASDDAFARHSVPQVTQRLNAPGCRVLPRLDLNQKPCD